MVLDEAIMQGTTPSLKIIISTDDFLLSNVTAIELYINNTSTKTYEMDDLVINTEENSLTKVFTELETTALDANKVITVQARFWFADGSIVGINKITINTADMLGVGN